MNTLNGCTNKKGKKKNNKKEKPGKGRSQMKRRKAKIWKNYRTSTGLSGNLRQEKRETKPTASEFSARSPLLYSVSLKAPNTNAGI